MNIYKHQTSNVLVTSPSGSTVTMKVIGGLMRQLYIKAGSTSTIFRANLVDDSSYTIRNWGYHTGELNDTDPLPLRGQYTVNITNTNQDDNFNILLSVQE